MKYIIIQTNCDCSSDIIARTNTNWIFGPRCPGCNKILGPMQWRDVAVVDAITQMAATEIYRKAIKR